MASNGEEKKHTLIIFRKTLPAVSLLLVSTFPVAAQLSHAQGTARVTLYARMNLVKVYAVLRTPNTRQCRV